MTRRGTLLVLLGGLTAPPLLNAQTPTFSARREIVQVDVLVSEGRAPAVDLSAEDFEVRDNGVLQHIELARMESTPLNVILAFDASRSVAGQRLVSLKAAGLVLLEKFRLEDRAALVTFNRVVTLRQALTDDTASVRAALQSLEGRGDTSLVDGVYASVLVGESDVGRSVVIVFSDGRDTASWLARSQVLDAVRRSDVVIYAVTTAGSRDAAFLRDVGRATGGGLLEIGSPAELASAFVSIFREFRDRYVLTYTPEGVGQDGWHELQVRVKRRGASVVAARPGYFR